MIEKRRIKLLITVVFIFHAIMSNALEYNRISIFTLQPELPSNKMFDYLITDGFREDNLIEGGSKVKVTLILSENYDLNEAVTYLEQRYGASLKAATPRYAEGFVSVDNIDSLLRDDRVVFLEESPGKPVDLNNGIINLLSISELSNIPYELFGENQTVGIWERFHAYNLTPDLQSRIQYGDDTNTTFGSNSYFYGDHATHVAGTLAGNGNLSSGLYRGIARKANILAYEAYDTLGELNSEIGDSVNRSIFILQNSWSFSATINGEYNSISQRLDEIINEGIDNKKGIMVYAAGNNRPDDCDDGEYDCISVQASAKNTIAVGAVESDLGAMTSFSSWGPTNDGRIKPDLVAPGCESPIFIQSDPQFSIFSTVPDLFLDIYNNENPNVGTPDGLDDIASTDYWGMCGTSMAAPVVSGTIALMMEQYLRNFSNNPLSSTIKAILIHTSKDIRNGDLGGFANPVDGPGFESGYGLVNPLQAVDQIRNKDFVESSLLMNGSNRTYYSRVENTGDPFKVTLVWDDLLGDVGANKELKNDLDLIVIDPDGQRHYPWTLDPNNPQNPPLQNQTDHLNNVEQVFVQNPPFGNWTIIVNGTNIISSQNFSLVFEGFYDPIPPISPTVWASPKKVGRNISVFWLEAKDLETGISEYQYQLDNTTNASYISVGQSRQISITNATQGLHTVYVRALDYFGNPSLPGNATFVFDSIAPTQTNISANFITPVSATINVDTNENATAHVEYGTTTSYGSIIGSEEFRQHQSVGLISLTSNTLYHYRVHSTDEAGNNISTADNTFTTGNSSNIVHSFSGSLLPFVTASPVVNVTFNRPGQWDLSWDISTQNATLNIYDPQGGLFASKTVPPATARFYLDTNMLGTYSMQVTYTPAANATLSWSISSTVTPWTTAYTNEYDNNVREAKSLPLGQIIIDT